MTNAEGKHAVIIVPTYNERPNIQVLLPAIDAVFTKIKDWKMSILVVDDSSPDGTADAVRELQKKYPYLQLLVNKRKSGLGGAYLKGMEHAFGELGADVVFEFDADLSHDPKKIPAFLKELDKGADLVLGSRYMKGGSIPENWGLHRKFMSVVGNLIITIVFTTRKVHDWTTGYRAIRRSVYEAVREEMKSSRFTGYTFQIGFLHKAMRQGFVIREVPFHFIDRTIGESKLGTEYIINTLKYIFRVRAEEIFGSRVMKFLTVGAIGFIVNFIFFHLFKQLALWTALSSVVGDSLNWLSFLTSDQGLAVVLSAECAIFSNYVLNNIWTFKDRKISGIGKHLQKFLHFNVGSIGSVVIQYITMQVGLSVFGLFPLIAIAGQVLESDNIYLVVGVLLGMIWNFSVYNLVIWRK